MQPDPSEEAWKYYSVADIFVLPDGGKGGIDGWGLVINEAASMNLPIVTTYAVGAADDLVINGLNGYVVQPGNISGLHNALEKLIKDKALRTQMGKESRRLFESINDYKKMYHGFHEAIKHVIQK